MGAYNNQQRCLMPRFSVYRVVLWFGILLFLLGGCTSNKFTFQLIKPTQEFSPKTSEYVSSDSSISVDELEFTFPGTINETEYEADIQSIFISYKPKKGKNEYVLYDLNENKIQWMGKGNPYISIFSNDEILLEKGKDRKLYDASNGNFIRDAEGYLYFLGDGRALILSPKKFALIDVRSGNEIWQKPGMDWEGYRWELWDGDWIYVIAKGLNAFKLEDGDGWNYLASTSHAAHGKEIARQAALSCLAAIGGGYNTSSYHAELTHNVCTYPLPTENEVFFAARKNIYSFQKQTGNVIWETEIDEELGSMDLYKLSNDDLALVGDGWKYVDFVIKKATPPSIRLFDWGTGDLLAKFELEKSDLTFDFEESPNGFLLLTSDKLYQVDKDLELLGILESDEQYGQFVNILSSADTLVVRTSLGLLAVSANSLQKLWFVSLGNLPVNEPKDKWKIPLYVRNYINERSTFIDNLYWTPTPNGLVAIDLEQQGKKVIEIPLLGSRYSIFADGRVVNFEDNKLKILTW